MKTQWSKWLLAAATVAVFSLGFVNPSSAGEIRAAGRATAHKPAAHADAIRVANRYRNRGYNRSRYGGYRGGVFVSPYYSPYGYNYGYYPRYGVAAPSVGWPALPAPFSYDTFHPALGY